MYNYCYSENIIYQDLGEQDKTWTEVKSICDSLGEGGYRLPTPDSQEYNDSLIKLAKNDMAIGFSKKENHEWTNAYSGTINILIPYYQYDIRINNYISEQPLTWTNWASGEPNYTGNPKFVQMWKGKNYQWDDVGNGRDTHHVICVKTGNYYSL